MCGIIGYLGNNNALDYLLYGLEKLEYRGYDSAGIAIKTNKIITIKDYGKVNHLKTLIPKDTFSNIGIGHTRWATHGKANKQNAHPHSSNNNQFTLVHNGIIENYLDIKEKYLSNYHFYSSTDTEVLVNLIEYLDNGNTLETLKKIKSIIKGSYALVFINKKENKLYFMKNQTPLVISQDNNEFIISSDSIAFKNNFTKQIILQDGDYGFIEKKSIHIYDYNNNKKELIFKNIEKDNFIKNNKIYQFQMEKEINDQPYMIDNIINNYFIDNKLSIPNNIIQNINKSNKIYIIGCGSSFYSGKIGKHYIEKNLNKEVEVILASEAIYDFPLINKKTYFIFVSQSGETLDVINVLKKCKELKIPTLGITNSINSTITHLCDNILYICAGRETSVASTKAFLGQSILFLLLSKHNDQNLINDLIQLKTEIKITLKNTTKIEQLANKIKTFNNAFYLGRNLDYYICLEGALKLKELSYIHAEAFPSGELKHGPLALIDNTVCIIGLISQEKTAMITRTNLMECKSRNGNIFIISKKSLSQQNDDITFNSSKDYLSPLIELIHIQLLAFYVAKIKGYDIDTPRNLAKSVTVE